MAELLMLEYEGAGEADYRRVGAQLGVDAQKGTGEWPAGLITHLAGTAGGRTYVVESWTSREAFDAFMRDRLGAALANGGMSVEPKVTWATLVGEHHPGG